MGAGRCDRHGDGPAARFRRALYVVGVVAALIGVMVLNLLAMLYARRILEVVGTMPLQIVGAVLSVLQVALGVQMILGRLRMIGVLDWGMIGSH